jgi:hypothetical protein
MSVTVTALSAAKLTHDDLARLTDAALEVILHHGAARPSLDVELALWSALGKAHQAEYRMARWLRLTGSRTPSRQEILSALAGAAFQVAIDSGAEASEMLELELDLLFAFQLVEVRATARAVLVA